jgi:transposase-like protein
VHTSQLRDWVKKFADDPQHAFPGHGQMKPEQLEIARLKREVAKLKAERDILKKLHREVVWVIFSPFRSDDCC